MGEQRFSAGSSGDELFKPIGISAHRVAATASIATAALLSFGGCASANRPQRMLALEYRDFRPQAAAHELIGFEWYQWNSHGSSRPSETDDVKVVVYRNTSLDDVRRQYPVIHERPDYRYVRYDDALAYCDRLVGEHPDLLGHLRETKRKIIAHLGQK